MKNFLFIILVFSFYLGQSQSWNSKWVWPGDDGKLNYLADDDGNMIPDFGRVGYHEGEEPPEVTVTIELSPVSGDNFSHIQYAIDSLAGLEPDSDGFRGCLLLQKGTYEVSDQLTISSSGIVIKGEGNNEEGTVVIATGAKQYSLFKIVGEGSLFEVPFTNTKIDMDFVPTGTKRIAVRNVEYFAEGDGIVVYRPGTSEWISDLKMDQIAERDDGGEITQWEPSSYNLHFQRSVDKIVGDTLVLDNPIVMQMEEKYGGGFVYKYAWKGRIEECGIENMRLKSVYASETDEDHAWDAIKIERAKDCWVENVTALHFGYSAVNISSTARNVSVLNCKCLEPKSEITGGRRYSFNCNGQLNLFKNCETTEGRHDFVTGSRVCGPNVFTQCEAKNAHSDIGPHHRWAVGTLYDVIKSDGQINVQDRGNYGSGHGWAGASQVLWNCWGSMICVQSPWVSAKNYAIGCVGVRWYGRHTDRPQGEWEGFNMVNLEPASLYEAQLKDKDFTTSANVIQNFQSNLCSVIKTNEVLQVEITNFEKEGSIELFCLNGRKLNQQTLQNKVNTIGLSGLSHGVYIYRVRIGNRSQNGKIVL